MNLMIAGYFWDCDPPHWAKRAVKMVLTNCFLPIALYLVHREGEREKRQMPLHHKATISALLYWTKDWTNSLGSSLVHHELYG
jgi:hypothetical protein